MKYFYLKLSMALLTLMMSVKTPAQTVATVGISDGSFCGFTQIQTAIDSGADEIRVLSNQIYQENLVINRSINLKGGYLTCAAAGIDQQFGGNTQIDASGSVGLPAIYINNADNASIYFNQLDLKNGIDTAGTDGGRGLNIRNSNALVELINVKIYDNTAEFGAGIYAGYPPESLNVILRDSYIFDNYTSFNGGGIFCGGNNTSITLLGASGIYQNEALNGGGIGAFGGCSVTIASGDDARQGATTSGVVRNTARDHGGGIIAGGSAKIYFQGNRFQFGLLGNSHSPATLAENVAEFGGGISAFGGSEIELYDALVWKNQASEHGGGFYLSEDVSLVMTTSDRSTCWNQRQCSILALNRAYLGGALYQDRGSSAVVNSSHIYSNQADWGLVIFSREDGTPGTTSRFHNNMIYRHGNNTFDFLDKYLFRGYEPVSIELIHNTITDNDINDLNSIMGAALGATFTVKNSIIHNNDETVYIGPEDGIEAECLLVNERDSFSGNSIAEADPVFVDPANNDYHLDNLSNAVDLCASINGFTHDIDGEPRGFNDPIQNQNGDTDAGADESYASDIIFKSDFQ